MYGVQADVPHTLRMSNERSGMAALLPWLREWLTRTTLFFPPRAPRPSSSLYKIALVHPSILLGTETGGQVRLVEHAFSSRNSTTGQVTRLPGRSSHPTLKKLPPDPLDPAAAAGAGGGGHAWPSKAAGGGGAGRRVPSRGGLTTWRRRC